MKETEKAKQPSALSRTLSRALNITVTTVIAGQVKPIRTTVRTTVEQQPYTTGPASPNKLGRGNLKRRAW